MGRQGLRRHERQLQMIDYPIHDGNLRDEGVDLHSAAALGTDHRINLIDLPHHGRPALGRDVLRLLLDHPERRRTQTCLLDLSPVGVGVQPIVQGNISKFGNWYCVPNLLTPSLTHLSCENVSGSSSINDKLVRRLSLKGRNSLKSCAVHGNDVLRRNTPPP